MCKYNFDQNVSKLPYRMSILPYRSKAAWESRGDLPGILKVWLSSSLRWRNLAVFQPKKLPELVSDKAKDSFERESPGTRTGPGEKGRKPTQKAAANAANDSYILESICFPLNPPLDTIPIGTLIPRGGGEVLYRARWHCLTRTVHQNSRMLITAIA